MTRLSRRLLLKLVPAAAVTTACGSPNVVPGHLAQNSPALRAMTFNIQSALRGLDGIAEVINSVKPDIVALQEVDRFSTRAHGLDQAAEIGARTGMPYSCHFRATTLYGGDYGVALISRHPLEDITQVPLPRQSDEEPRTVGRARIEVLGQRVSIYVTHLAHMPTNGALRAEQTKAILSLIDQDSNAKIVM